MFSCRIGGKKFAGNENILLTIKEVENAVKDKNGFETLLRNKCLELSDEIKLTETLTKIFGETKGNAFS